MSKLDSLLSKYQRSISAPWRGNIAAPQKVMFVVYEPSEELRLRMRMPEFKMASVEAGHSWQALDLSTLPARWIGEHEYRDSYFESPESLVRDTNDDVAAFNEWLYARTNEWAEENASPDAVLALYGVGALFGFSRVAALVDEIKKHIQGRLVVFFPGDLREGAYRLLDARDGWNYLAMAIVADDE